MMKRTFQNFILVCAVVASGSVACTVQSLTGNVMNDYATEHMIPYLLSEGDTDAACGAGLAFGAFLSSFERVTDAPHRAAIPSLLSAATCAESQAWENELRSLRAIKDGKPQEAKDARIAQQRAHQTAAVRLYSAYRRTVIQYGEPGATCPVLETEYDQLVWMLGMMAAITGIQHDRAAGGAAGIPMDAPPKAARGMACLNNQAWWHVPSAVQGAIWATVPGSGPEDIDPWKQMMNAAQAGDQTGVRLARAVHIQAARGSGKTDIMKASIMAFGETVKSVAPAARWKTLDRMAFIQVRAISDQLWTEAEGHRTPFQGVGDLPGKEEPVEDADDDLLDGLGGRIIDQTIFSDSTSRG
jgi:hypothetical protein